MAIDALRNGTFRAQVMIDGKRFNKTFPTEQQAKDWIEDQKRKARRGDVVELPSKNSLASVIDKYIEDDGNWSADKTQHLSCLKRDLGHHALAKLTNVVIYDYIAGLKTSPGNASSRMSYLKSALLHAELEMHLTVRMDGYEKARLGLNKKKKLGRSYERTRRPTLDEISLISDCHTEDYRAIDLPAILEILSVLPIRVGELLKIKWTDIDHAKRTVTLRQRKHPDPRVKARRDETIPLLKAKKDGKIIETYDLLVTARKKYGNQEGPFPYRVKAVSNIFAKARAIAEVEDLHVHDLRAHAITTMLEAGNEPMMVMFISGHRDPVVFYKRYVRLDLEKVRDSIEAKLAA